MILLLNKDHETAKPQGTILQPCTDKQVFVYSNGEDSFAYFWYQGEMMPQVDKGLITGDETFTPNFPVLFYVHMVGSQVYYRIVNFLSREGDLERLDSETHKAILNGMLSPVTLIGDLFTKVSEELIDGDHTSLNYLREHPERLSESIEALDRIKIFLVKSYSDLNAKA